MYAVAVFVSFLAGLLAMARFSRQQGNTLLTATNLAGAVASRFTLVVNLARGYPLIAIAGTHPRRRRPLLAVGTRRSPARDRSDRTSSRGRRRPDHEGAIRHEPRPGVSFAMVSREAWSACMESRLDTTGL